MRTPKIPCIIDNNGRCSDRLIPPPPRLSLNPTHFTALQPHRERNVAETAHENSACAATEGGVEGEVIEGEVEGGGTQSLLDLLLTSSTIQSSINHDKAEVSM